MCFYDDGESPEFSSGEQIRKARKNRRCDGCFVPDVIQRGDLYSHHAGKYEGDFYTVVQCGQCHRDRHRIHEAELSRGCRWEESWCPVDETREHLAEYELSRSSRGEGQAWLAGIREPKAVLT